MPNAQDEHRIALDPVSKDIGPHDRHLPPPLPGIAASMREFREAVGKFDQPPGEMLGGGLIVDGDVSDDRFEMLDRIFRPDDPRQISRRSGASAAASRYPRIGASGVPRRG